MCETCRGDYWECVYQTDLAQLWGNSFRRDDGWLSSWDNSPTTKHENCADLHVYTLTSSEMERKKMWTGVKSRLVMELCTHFSEVERERDIIWGKCSGMTEHFCINLFLMFTEMYVVDCNSMMWWLSCGIHLLLMDSVNMGEWAKNNIHHAIWNSIFIGFLAEL